MDSFMSATVSSDDSSYDSVILHDVQLVHFPSKGSEERCRLARKRTLERLAVHEAHRKKVMKSCEELTLKGKVRAAYRRIVAFIKF